jgi:REP element-mobilizing transposase RayT
MARPLRIEFQGALHHVMARGNARAPILDDDDDRQAWVDTLAKTASRVDWRVWAYCLMDGHYHLLVETPQPNVSRGTRELNGAYTQAFNHRHHGQGTGLRCVGGGGAASAVFGRHRSRAADLRAFRWARVWPLMIRCGAY